MLTDEQIRKVREMALGRILRLGSRPEQPGDVAEYERCRAIVMADGYPPETWAPSWARDHAKGAKGG